MLQISKNQFEILAQNQEKKFYNRISDPNKIYVNDYLLVKAPDVPSKAAKASEEGKKNAVKARDAKSNQF